MPQNASEIGSELPEKWSEKLLPVSHRVALVLSMRIKQNLAILLSQCIASSENPLWNSHTCDLDSRVIYTISCRSSEFSASAANSTRPASTILIFHYHPKFHFFRSKIMKSWCAILMDLRDAGTHQALFSHFDASFATTTFLSSQLAFCVFGLFWKIILFSKNALTLLRHVVEQKKTWKEHPYTPCLY